MSVTISNKVLTIDANECPELNVEVKILQSNKGNKFGKFFTTSVIINNSLVTSIKVKNTKGNFYIGGARGANVKFNEGSNSAMVHLMETIWNKMAAELEKQNLPLHEKYVDRTERLDSSGKVYPVGVSLSMQFYAEKHCLVEIFNVSANPPCLLLSTENEVDANLAVSLFKSDGSDSKVKARNFIKRAYNLPDVECRKLSAQQLEKAKDKNAYYPISGDDNYSEFTNVKDNFYVCEVLFAISPYFISTRDGKASAKLNISSVFCKNRVSSIDTTNNETDDSLSEYMRANEANSNEAKQELVIQNDPFASQ